MSLEEIYTKAAHRFLQSVLVVDDRRVTSDGEGVPSVDLIDPSPFGSVGERSPQQAVTPGANGETVSNAEDADPPTEGTAPDDDPGAVPLDTDLLTVAFANLGIVCAALKPEPGNNLKGAVVQAGRRCDIVLLDWHIDAEDLDATALPLLDELTDPESPGLRLVAIYSGDPKLNEIEDSVLGLSDVVEDVEGGPFRYRRKNSYILILCKSGSKSPIHVEGAEQVNVVDLPERLIKEFARHASGLVPSATMSALGAVREGVREVLAVLNDTLDAGFVSHRLTLPSPDDASDHLADLIVSELASIVLDDEARAACTDSSAVELWISELDPAAVPAPASPGILKVLNANGWGKAGIEALVDGGHFSSKTRAKEDFIEAEPEPTLFAVPPTSAELAHAIFAERMATVHPYENSRPSRLELGVIVRAVVGGRYLVCVQPLCDSVRLTGVTAVPFLPLSEVTAGAFDFTLVRSGAPIRLRLETKPGKLALLEFQPDAVAQCILAKASPGGGERFAMVSGIEYEAFARLKPRQALRVAQQLATAISRVGLNESEWQRRRSKRH